MARKTRATRKYRRAEHNRKRMVELILDPESGVMVVRRGTDEGTPERHLRNGGIHRIDWLVNKGGVVSGKIARASKENIIDYLERKGALGRRFQNDRESDRVIARHRKRAAEWVLQTHRKARFLGRTISLYHERSSFGVPEITRAEQQARKMLRSFYRKLGPIASEGVVDIVIFDHVPADDLAIWTLCQRLDLIAVWRQMVSKPPNSLQKSEERGNARLTRRAAS